MRLSLVALLLAEVAAAQTIGRVNQGIGLTDGGFWRVGGGTDNAPLIARPPMGMLSAFGDHKVVEDAHEVHFEFVYNVNSAHIATTIDGGGTVTQAAGHAVLQTGAADGGYAEMHSRAVVKYVAGQGVAARWTSVFTAGVAGNRQEIGLGNTVDGLLFGYNGTSFGIIHRNASVETIIPQASWNKATLLSANPFTLDPTKGNIYFVQYQWLGYGSLNFFVVDPATGFPVMVHQIARGNANTTVSLSNPSLALWARTYNSGAATNVTLRTPSMTIVREGPLSTFGVRGSAANRKTGISTETNILTLRNNTTFASVTSRLQVRIDLFSLTCSTDCTFRLVVNPTIGGTPSFTDFDSSISGVAIDTAGTTRTGGQVVMAFVLDGNNGQIVNFVGRELYIYPGDTLAVTASSITGSLVANAAVSWLEEN